MAVFTLRRAATPGKASTENATGALDASFSMLRLPEFTVAFRHSVPTHPTLEGPRASASGAAPDRGQEECSP